MSTFTRKAILSPTFAMADKAASKKSMPPKTAHHETSSTEPSGDTLAPLQRIYADHASGLQKYVTRILRDLYRAEDVFQETMLRPWRHAEILESVFVARALARLRPAHREVLHAIFYADRTAVQAADVLGIPVGTVKSRTYYALCSLRVYLEDELSCSSAA